MIKNKNIANAGWIVGCRIVQSLLALVISMLIARYFGPSQFGLINYAASIVAFIAPVVHLGLSHVIVQEITYSPESEGKILGSSIAMSFVSSIVCIIAVICFSILTNQNDSKTVLVCGLYSLLLIAQALEIIQYWFQSKLLSKYTAVVSVVAYIIISIYKVVLLITKQSIYCFAVSNAIDHLIIGIVLLFIFRKKCGHKLEFSLVWAKKLFEKSKYFIVSSMMVTIFAQTDKIMLRFMIDDTATGFYSAASTSAAMTSFVFVAIIDSMRPTIIACKKNESKNYKTNLCRLNATIIFLALAQSIVMTVLADPIIRILYGSEYLSSISVLRIIVWQTTFSYMGSVRNVWMLAENKQRYLWIINLSGALTNVVLNILFIPICGVKGAAIASLVTQIFTNFIISFILKPIRYNNKLIVDSLHPLFIVDTIKSIAVKLR